MHPCGDKGQSFASRLRETILSLLSTDEDASGVPCPVLGSPVQGGYKLTGTELAQGHVGAAERAGALQHVEKKRLWGGSFKYKYLMGGNGDGGARLFSLALSGRTKRQWTQVKTQGIPSEHKETPFYCEGRQTLEQVALRG